MTEELSDSPQPLLTIGGQELRLVFSAATGWLERHSAYINSLNVFPVPDGDSGTNMLLTMQAAIKEIETAPDHSASAICNALAHGALYGSKGNSGTILCKILDGFARAIQTKDKINAKDFAVAMVEGARVAYGAVQVPVEGTMLTVIRESADAAMVSASQNDDLHRVLSDTVDAARVSVVKTPYLLPVLKEAGVVDAGGQGLLVILEGALKFLKGEPMEFAASGQGAQALEMISREEGWGFDIQYHIRGADIDVDAVRNKIFSMGESALVVGDSSLVKVHVHAPTPGTVLDYGCSVGTISNIIVENMQEQYIEFMAKQVSQRPSVRVEDIAGITTITIAPSGGLTNVFESLGAGTVIAGGQTMNPSTGDIVQAIENAKADQVIVLPNNKNIIPAAEQAKGLTKKQVMIVPTKTIPQGIAALIAFNFQKNLEENAKAMIDAAKNIMTLEITTATRAATLDRIQVKQGQIIGLIDDQLAGAGEELDQVTLDLLRKMRADEKEIVTLYYGDSITAPKAETFGQMIRTRFPSQQVEIIHGGQPHYHYIISVE